MPGKAPKITITERQQAILQTFSRSVTAPSQPRQRASIVVLAFDGLLNEDIAERVGPTHRQVGRWRRRWANAWNRLMDIECCESRAVLRRAIKVVLTDEPRPGAPGKFTPEQVTPTLAVACEPPEKSGRPITHWTAQELTEEVVRRGIVALISPSPVSRSLREAALQPHKSRSWLNTTEKDPARFEEQVKAVCDTYLAAPERERTHQTHTVSVDAMTGLQALERIAPSKAMIAGIVPDRQLGDDDRRIAQADDRSDADGDRLRQPHRADGGHRPEGFVRVYGGYLEHPLLGELGEAGGRGV